MHTYSRTHKLSLEKANGMVEGWGWDGRGGSLSSVLQKHVDELHLQNIVLKSVSA